VDADVIAAVAVIHIHAVTDVHPLVVQDFQIITVTLILVVALVIINGYYG